MTNESLLPPQAGASPTPPRTPAEAEILAMTLKVLELPALGVEDNLLDLGAESLSLGQLVVRMRQRYGVEVRLVPFFRTPTVAYLASLLERRREAPNEP